MSRHEIEIEGLPEGWVPESINVTLHSWDANGNLKMCCGQIAMRRKVRKYDWSKTLDDVLLTSHAGFIHKCARTHYPHKIATIWQPNIHGKCPVDSEASVVRVRLSNGSEYEKLAKDVSWDLDLRFPVVAWQFIRLADGVEF